MRFVYQWVKTVGLIGTVLVLASCGSQPRYVELGPLRGYALNDALRKLHDLGLRASFPAAKTPCGDGLPAALFGSPRTPARVKRGSTVPLKFGFSPIPSPSVPIHHARWTHVPALVGKPFTEAASELEAIWPCVHIRGETSTSGTRMVVIAQSPRAETRVPAFGVRVGGGYRPTTVDLTVAAR
jgi:beta-lactam-binding protein with PASTA domain